MTVCLHTDIGTDRIMKTMKMRDRTNRLCRPLFIIRTVTGPATGHLDTGFSWFPCVYKQMLRWFPRFQVTTTCFSCSPPDLNLVVTN